MMKDATEKQTSVKKEEREGAELIADRAERRAVEMNNNGIHQLTASFDPFAIPQTPEESKQEEDGIHYGKEYRFKRPPTTTKDPPPPFAEIVLGIDSKDGVEPLDNPIVAARHSSLTRRVSSFFRRTSSKCMDNSDNNNNPPRRLGSSRRNRSSVNTDGIFRGTSQTDDLFSNAAAIPAISTISNDDEDEMVTSQNRQDNGLEPQKHRPSTTNNTTTATRREQTTSRKAHHRLKPGEPTPGAYSEGERAFGERPAWAQTQGSDSGSVGYSIDTSMNEGGGIQQESDGVMYVDILFDTTDEREMNWQSGRSSMRSGFVSTAGGGLDIRLDGDLETASCELSNAQYNFDTTTQSKSWWFIRSKRNQKIAIISLIVLACCAIAVGVVVPLAGGDRKDDINTNDVCDVSKLESTMNEQFYCECQKLSADSELRLRYDELERILYDLLYSREELAEDLFSSSNNTNDLFSSPARFDCNEIRTAALWKTVANTNMATTTTSRVVEHYAISVLYLSLGCWGWNDNPICSWEGVMCKTDVVAGPTVVSLSLRRGKAKGTLPAEIGLLEHLEILDLNENMELEGTIPPEVGRLTNLSELCCDSVWC